MKVFIVCAASFVCVVGLAVAVLTYYYKWKEALEQESAEKEQELIRQKEQAAQDELVQEMANVEALDARVQELLRLRAEGLSYGQIAKQIDMSKTTVIRKIKKAQKK